MESPPVHRFELPGNIEIWIKGTPFEDDTEMRSIINGEYHRVELISYGWVDGIEDKQRSQSWWSG